MLALRPTQHGSTDGEESAFLEAMYGTHMSRRHDPGSPFILFLPEPKTPWTAGEPRRGNETKERGGTEDGM